MIYFPLTLLSFFLFLLFFFFFFKLFPCLLPDLSKGKQALHLVSRSSALDNLSFQPVWKSGNPYAWNLIIDISAAGRVIRPITASWIQGRGNGWLHSFGLLFRYSALNGLILIYLSFPWRRTTNCTENIVSRVMQSDLPAAHSSSSPLEKAHVLGSFMQERGRVWSWICSFSIVNPCVGERSRRHPGSLPSGLQAIWASIDQANA